MKIQMIPRFPAIVQGANGDTVTKASGVYTVRPDYSSLAIGTIGDPPDDDGPVVDAGDLYTRVWNSLTGVYNRIALASIAAFFTGWTRQGKVASYTGVTGDSQTLIAFNGGGSMLTYTLGAPGGYAADYVSRALNINTTRALKVDVNGFVFFLYPGQMATFVIQGGAWFVDRPALWKLPSNAFSFYVRTDGSNNNDGLADTATGAFQTHQKAWDTLVYDTHINGKSMAIRTADGTYGTGLLATGMPAGVGSTTQIPIIGNTTTPANCMISTSGTNCFQAGDSAGGTAQLYIDGFELRAASGNCIETHHGSSCKPGAKIRFGPTTGIHIYGHTGGYVVESPPGYTISGGATWHYFAGQNSNFIVHGTEIVIENSPVFFGFAYAGGGGQLLLDGMTYTGKNTVTGFKGWVDPGGTIVTNTNDATYLPGSSALQIHPAGNYDNLGCNDQSVTVLAGAAIPLTTGVAVNVCTLTLAPGSWDVYFHSNWKANAAASVQAMTASISASTGLIDGTVGRMSVNSFGAGYTIGANFDPSILVGPVRFDVTTAVGSLPIYGVARGDFSGGGATLSAYGKLQAVPHR